MLDNIDMYGLNHSLNRKFIAGTAAGLLISCILFNGLYLNQYNNQLSTERSEAASRVTNLLQTSLENAMLKRDLDGLTTIVNQLGNQNAISNVFITNPAGEIRFSSNPVLKGNIHKPDKSLISNPNPVSFFTQNSLGEDVFRSVNPVHNQQPCEQCHGPRSLNPVNGILYVDFPSESLRENARNTTLILMASGALIVIINLLGGWWFINKYVLKPVHKLSENSTKLMQGDLDARSNLGGQDELSKLGTTLDKMAINLQNKIQDLQDNKAFLQSLVDAIPDGVRIIDMNMQIILTNQSYLDQLGSKESHVNISCYASSHHCNQPCAPTLTTCPVYEISHKGQPIKVLHQHIREDGSKLDVEIYAAPMQAIIDGQEQQLIVESIRDLNKDIKYSHEQKLSELGKLAAGVAHEIHNPLSSIRLALDASTRSLENMESSKETAEYLSVVDKEIDKCIEVSKRLLKLSTASSSQREIVDVNAVLADTVSLLSWEAEKYNIEVTQHYEPDMRVIASDSDMRMIALNIIQNAFHAMPKGGQICITGKHENKKIILSFKDTGVGIRAEDLNKIFDPFFSRRADHKKGTGLGLSITRNLVDEFEGDIDVDSTVGQGSTFTLFFPDPDLTNGGSQ